MLSELETTMSKVYAQLVEHYKYHGQVAKALHKFNQLQGICPPSFMKDNGEYKTNQE